VGASRGHLCDSVASCFIFEVGLSVFYVKSVHFRSVDLSVSVSPTKLHTDRNTTFCERIDSKYTSEQKSVNILEKIKRGRVQGLTNFLGTPNYLRNG